MGDLLKDKQGPSNTGQEIELELVERSSSFSSVRSEYSEEENDTDSRKDYNQKGIFNFLFLTWVPYWLGRVTKNFVDFTMLPPLPEADKISYWQEVFSKKISDGLMKLEASESAKARSQEGSEVPKPYRDILLRALVLTFWRRILILAVMAIAVKCCNLGMVNLLKRLLGVMKTGDNIKKQIGLIAVIIIAEILNSIFEQHLYFYKFRTEFIIEAALSITLFQHGMCHRKDYSNDIDKFNRISSCKGFVHSCDPRSNDCSENPLMCPAKRHRNRELSPHMYTYLYYDTNNVVSVVDAIVNIMKIICVGTFGMLMVRQEVGSGVFKCFMIIMTMITTVVCIEFVGGHVLKNLLCCRDMRISNITDVVGSLNPLRSAGMEDIGYNIIQNSREDELVSLRLRCSMFFFNKCLMFSIRVIVVLVVLMDFIEALKNSIGSSSFDITAPITTLFLLTRIMRTMSSIPSTMKIMFETHASWKRLSKFLNDCSPNYYLSSDERSKNLESSALTLVNEPDSDMSDDNVVIYRDASFTWKDNRNEIINTPQDKDPLLRSVNFELKRGDFKIITGSQGCGKTSFIKSILGEMSLVSGSMAVAPLSTGMPIFYTSQEIWLPTDNIKSLITFGYNYDQELYNEVVRCAELVTDFSAWEDGDLRVISEKGYSLSGGQRVRVSLARALYAYMIFSKANETMENNRCCFLMCLDEPFNGLDVKVATAIFNNLFNKDTGLLVRDDIAVVMAMSRMTIDSILNLRGVGNAVPMETYCIEAGFMSEMKEKATFSAGISRASRVRDSGSRPSYHRSSTLSRMPKDVFEKCESGRFWRYQLGYLSCKTLRSEVETGGVTSDAMEQNKLCTTKWSYFTYFFGIGYVLCIVIALMIIGGTVMETLNGLYIAEWTDQIKKIDEKKYDEGRKLIEMMAVNAFTALLVRIFSTLYIVFMLTGFTLFVVGNLRGCRKLHTFALNSIFHKSSTVITLKKSIGATITMFSSDFLHIDEKIMKQFSACFVHIIRVIIKGVTICITIPFATPFIIGLFLVLYFFIIRNYILSSKKIQCLMLDAISNINGLYTSAIVGSPIYRSFRRERHCRETIMSHSEYLYRSKFLKLSLNIWVIIAAKMITCAGTAVVCFLPILSHFIFGTELKVGKTGYGIMLLLSFNDMLSVVIHSTSLTERMMCSIARFEHYFLQGKFHLKEQFESMNESILSVSGPPKDTKMENKKRVAELVKRRRVEYRNFMFRRYRSLLSTLFYKPKIDVLDISAYLPADHTTLKLDNVRVLQPNQQNQEEYLYILKEVNAKTCAGDVIGIVGRTGAGKSTLLSVLQSTARRREGSVLLDGRELKDIPRSILRHVIGVLPQIPFVFKGWTLRRFLDPRMLYTDEEIYDALECCGLVNMVNAITEGKGLDVVLTPETVKVNTGLYLFIPLIRIKKPHDDNVIVRQDIENGNNSHIPETCFSMGQLRMLSFARLILYRDNYRILLIDEPPSDNIVSNEQAKEPNDVTNKEPDDGILPIYNLVKIYFKHCTTFIVAHDKHVLRSCNTVWVLKDGVLSDICSLTEYMSRGDRMSATSY